jgi:hypothetical protein
MMNTGVIFAVAIVLLALIARALVRSRDSAQGVPPGADADEFLVRLPPTALLARCISVDDVAYISRLQSPSLSHLLFSERRRLALMWLSQTRREAARLYRFHLSTSAQAENLRPAAEIQLLFHFVAFWFLYQILIFVVWFYGPLRTEVFVRSIRALADILASHVERIARAITSARAPELRAGRNA